MAFIFSLTDRLDEQQKSSSDKLMNANNKAYSEMQLKNNSNANISKKTHSENAINYITDAINEMPTTTSMKRDSVHKSNDDLAETNNTTNSFLNADRGLWSSKDSLANNSDGGASSRKLRQQRNQETKTDMKRYGTMEKLDVSDLVLTEGVNHSSDGCDEDRDSSGAGSDVWESPLHFGSGGSGAWSDERDRQTQSPDLYYDEDVEHFMENFHHKKKVQQQLSSSPRIAKLSLQSTTSVGSGLDRKSGLQTVNAAKPRIRSVSGLSDSFLTESGEHVKRLDSISSEGKPQGNF